MNRHLGRSCPTNSLVIPSRRQPRLTSDITYNLPVKQRLFNFLTGLSLLLFAVVLVIWFRSYPRGESLEKVAPTWRIVISSNRGVLSAAHWRGRFTTSPTEPLFIEGTPHEVQGEWAHWTQFAYHSNVSSDAWWCELGLDIGGMQVRPTSGIRLHDWLSSQWTGRQRWISVPHWLTAVLFASLPAFRWALPLLRRRARQEPRRIHSSDHLR
jgi:hypothetical protein